jgi:hypothetical protein
MQPQDLERIAKLALRELGAGDPPVTVSADGRPDHWRLAIGGNEPAILTIRAGTGTSANHIREQVFRQFAGR